MKKTDKLNDYDAFVENFKPKRTTDDCYTPPAVYEAVKGWAVKVSIHAPTRGATVYSANV